MKTTLVLSLVSLLFGVLFFLVSVAGLFWPSTPLDDIGMLSTTVVFVLLGVFGLLLARAQGRNAQQTQ